mmetsp:Transcript_28125/g.61774  ORF Transcript_28125/g.61774 Transcript_28125/m.61774 type:complete len:225 (+) Transcript_28125:2878-3552(+)
MMTMKSQRRNGREETKTIRRKRPRQLLLPPQPLRLAFGIGQSILLFLPTNRRQRSPQRYPLRSALYLASSGPCTRLPFSTQETKKARKRHGPRQAMQITIPTATFHRLPRAYEGTCSIRNASRQRCSPATDAPHRDAVSCCGYQVLFATRSMLRVVMVEQPRLHQILNRCGQKQTFPTTTKRLNPAKVLTMQTHCLRRKNWRPRDAACARPAARDPFSTITAVI